MKLVILKGFLIVLSCIAIVNSDEHNHIVSKPDRSLATSTKMP